MYNKVYNEICFIIKSTYFLIHSKSKLYRSVLKSGLHNNLYVSYIFAVRYVIVFIKIDNQKSYLYNLKEN